MELHALGIDIAKRKFDVTLLIGGKAKHKVCENTPAGFQSLLDWLSRQGVEKVHGCMEATSTYGEALAIALCEAGHVVSIVNPVRVQGFAQSELIRTKTDRTDAGLIARFCAAMQPEPWTLPSLEVRQLQALVRRLDSLRDMLQQEENRQETGSPSTAVTGSIQHVITVLQAEMAAVEQRIRDHFDQHPGLKSQRDLLTSIPGIGEKTAAVILAELRCVANFDSARQVAAFTGLAPRECTSGSSVHGRTRMSKTGNARLRKALFFPAINAKRFSPVFAAFAKRLEHRGKAPKAIVGAVMRKLMHAAFGVLKSGQPFDASYMVIA